MTARPNLFQHAPHELSHSAFWAWVLESLNTRSEKFSDVRNVGNRLLQKVGAPVPKAIKVDTEHPFPSVGRQIDVYAQLDERRTVLIENKVQDRPSTEKLEAYREATTVEEPYFLLISTAYPTQKERDVEKDETWKFLGPRTVLGLFDQLGVKHPVLIDYQEWLATKVEERQEKERKALSPDLDERVAGLRTVPGQWKFMEEVAGSFDGWQKTEHNARGGGVFTEYWFVEDEDGDTIFYRVEMLSKGPVFRVEQYQQPERPDLETKKKRLEELRDLWFESVNQAGQLPWSQHNTGAKYRCEIARLPLQEYGAAEVKEELKRLHPHFTEKLASQGWPVS